MSEKYNVSKEEKIRQAEFADKVKTVLAAEFYDCSPKAFIHTYGCQGNVSDSERIMGMLKEMGYEFTNDASKADLILYNTCAVREHAEDRVFGNVGAVKKYKKDNPHLIIALCGCMMQQEHIRNKIYSSYPFVDLVFGTHAVTSLPELLYRTLSGNKRVFYAPDSHGEIAEDIPIYRDRGIKAWLPIMYGCDNFCTYCIVPYVRGREKSREPQAIIREIEELVADGVTEIMLLGQNVNSYGKTLETPVTFAELLKEVEKIEGLKRIRFMTSHPKDLSDELIQTMAESQKICHHLHLPLQSGSSRVLKEMNRRYDKEKYLELVNKIRKAIPDISLTTDIMVGFPGETEEDFQETLDVVRKANYDTAFTFIYSKRSGTPAAGMENQVPEDVVKDRFSRLLTLVQEKGRENSSRFQGTIQEILVEDENREKGTLTGRTQHNLLVHFPGEKELIGKYVKVSLDTCKGFYYFGHMVEE